jgi:hypothetical protein
MVREEDGGRKKMVFLRKTPREFSNYVERGVSI